MRNAVRPKTIGLVWAVLLAVGCMSQIPETVITSTITPSAAAPTQTSAPTLTSLTLTLTPSHAASGGGACQVLAGGVDVLIYTRPSFEADVFAPLDAAEFPILIQARTADGWLGFDPGVAQAANVGVFRLRWVNEAQVSTSGDCAGAPVVVGPPPGVCFFMPMTETPVYLNFNDLASIFATLIPEQYAAIIGVSATGWARVDLGVGNSGLAGQGWVAPDMLNINGPCDALPTVEP